MPTPDQYIIQKATMDGIANAVRGMRHEKGAMTPAQIEAKIRGTRLGYPISVSVHTSPETGEWERPSEYPNLDAIEMSEDFEGVYMTYDLRKAPDYGWIGVSVNRTPNNGEIVVERGHLENNVFVADYSQIITASLAVFRQDLDATNGNVQLWRLYAPTAKITRFYFRTNTETAVSNYNQYSQPCVEITGQLKNLTGIVSDAPSYNVSACTWGTYWMERDSRKVSGNSVTTMIRAWGDCRNLRSLDFSDWNTSDWSVTTLYRCFYNCFSLQSLDLSGWDTSNWTVTSIQEAWAYCYSLETLNFSGWDTSNWEVTSLGAAWLSCESLKQLDISMFDTKDWAVTNLSQTWQNCYSLRYLDLSDWDTSNWAVTTIESCWNACRALEGINLNNWDTSNWAVTTIRYAWTGCYSLQSLDLSAWDTGGWAVTNMYQTWYFCYSLRFLDVSSWDTSDWAVTTIGACWYCCYSLKELDLAEWNTSNWAITTLEGTWQGCWSLEYLDLSGWDTSNWAVTTLRSTWADCYSLTVLDIGGLDTSDWPLASLYNTWNNCHSLREIIGLNDLDTSNWPLDTIASSASYGPFVNCWSLREIDISNWDTSKFKISSAHTWFNNNYACRTIKCPTDMGDVSTSSNTSNPPAYTGLINFNGYKIYVNHSYANAVSLSHASLVNILTNLPTVTSKTITLSQVNKLKLTAEEIAVATQKGWTVA